MNPILIPLTNGDELMVHRRHAGGLRLALRFRKFGPASNPLPVGVIAAEHVEQLRAALSPGAATPAPIWQPTPPAPVTGGDVICSALFFAGLFALVFLTP